MAGTGTATIDWGDGSAPTVHTLSPYDGNDFTPTQTFFHVYDNGDTRNIIITGQNITHLRTGKPFLYRFSNIDVSKNTALTYSDDAWRGFCVMGERAYLCGVKFKIKGYDNE
jgi:hypothetical protein